jgi:mannose-6-phosphate isomerase-like protein (cupin superfamily)
LRRVPAAALTVLLATAALAACTAKHRPEPPRAETPVEAILATEVQDLEGAAGLDAALATRPIGGAPLRLDLLAQTDRYSVHLAQIRGPLPRHVHRTHTERTYVLRGRGTTEIDGRTYPALAGTSYRIAPGVPHGAAPDEGETLVALVVFEPPMPRGDEDRVPAPER